MTKQRAKIAITYPTTHPDDMWSHPVVVERSGGQAQQLYGPTPHSRLVICVNCGVAEWKIADGQVQYHACRLVPRFTSRMRDATPKEYAAARAALKR